MIDAAFERVKNFISKNPYFYLVDESDKQLYLNFRNDLKIIFFNGKILIFGTEKTFFNRFYDIFFTYNATENKYLTKETKFLGKYFFDPLKIIRQNLILNKELDFKSFFHYINLIPDIETKHLFTANLENLTMDQV